MSDIEVSLQNQLGDFRLSVDFVTPAQGVTALFGRSGSGKSSVLRAVAGLARPTRGTVRINYNWNNINIITFKCGVHDRPT